MNATEGASGDGDSDAVDPRLASEPTHRRNDVVVFSLERLDDQRLAALLPRRARDDVLPVRPLRATRSTAVGEQNDKAARLEEGSHLRELVAARIAPATVVVDDGREETVTRRPKERSFERAALAREPYFFPHREALRGGGRRGDRRRRVAARARAGREDEERRKEECSSHGVYRWPPRRRSYNEGSLRPTNRGVAPALAAGGHRPYTPPVTRTVDRRLSLVRLTSLALATLAIYAVELGVAQAVPPSLPVRWAMAFDLVVLVPAVWWVFGLRHVSNGGRRLVTVVLVSTTMTALIVPQIGALLRALAVPIELAVVAAAALAVRRAFRESPSTDVSDAWERALVATVGDHAIARFLAAEASALYHATIGFRRVAGARPGIAYTLEASRAVAFTYGLVLVTVVESLATHVWLSTSAPVIAWTLSALGVYAILWLVGQDRAIRARTIDVEADALVLRAGLRLSARVPWSQIEGATLVSWSAPPEPRPGYLDAARPIEPTLLLTFREPVTVTAAFGIRRSVTAVGVGVDDAAGLRDVILARTTQRRLSTV